MRNSPRCDIWLVLDLEGINVSPVYEILSLTFHRIQPKILNFDTQKNRLDEIFFRDFFSSTQNIYFNLI